MCGIDSDAWRPGVRNVQLVLSTRAICAAEGSESLTGISDNVTCTWPVLRAGRPSIHCARSIIAPLYHIVCMEQDSRTARRAKPSVGSVEGPKLNETDLTSAGKDGSLAFPFLFFEQHMAIATLAAGHSQDSIAMVSASIDQVPVSGASSTGRPRYGPIYREPRMGADARLDTCRTLLVATMGWIVGPDSFHRRRPCRTILPANAVEKHGQRLFSPTLSFAAGSCRYLVPYAVCDDGARTRLAVGLNWTLEDVCVLG